MRGLVAVIAFASVASTSRAWSPETNYALQCQGCHLADGSASPGKVPGLAGSVAQFLRVPDGRAYLGRVPGVANAPLSDADLAALLDWTLHRFDPAHVPADYVPYSADEIRRLRATPLVDVGAERRRILDELERLR